MKIWSDYIKEMKIAARGFYFYIEILFAVIVVVILLFAVNEESVSKEKEFIYYDTSQELLDTILKPYFDDGTLVQVEDTVFNLKPMSFDLVDKDTGEKENYNFEAKTIVAKTIEQYDLSNGKLEKTIYLMNSFEDMLQMSYKERTIGAVVNYKIDENYNFEDHYKYYLQGYETERYLNVLSIIHSENLELVQSQIEKQNVRVLEPSEMLNNREAIVPVFLAFSGAIMGIFVVMAYVFLDKDEGVIKAFAVTPASMSNYLLSKILVILTNVVFSCAIITIPIMGLKPNYLLLTLFLLLATFCMTSLGLLLSSFFNNITKSFGVMYIVMIILMLPLFSFYIPSFDPLWLRFFPSYSMLYGFKDILLGGKDISYILLYSAIYLVSGILIFEWAKIRFRKTLTV